MKAIYRVSIVLALICSCLSPRFSDAQSAKTIFAQVSGQVLDLNGHPIAAATVRLEARGTSSTATDASGHFIFANIPPGTYTVVVNASGYETVTRNSIAISNEDVSLDINLAPVTGLKEIGHVEATSGRSSINVTAAPSYNLTPQDMAFQGETQWRKVLEEIPGVSVSDVVGFISSSVPGNPVNGEIVSIRGALQYETAMLIDNMPMYGTTLSTQPGNGVDLASYNPQAFNSFDIVVGPGAQSPSIVGSIGGSLNLHPAGQVTQNRYDFSLSDDPYGGWIANSLVAIHAGKLSATVTYGFDNSPGPVNGRLDLIEPGYVGGTELNTVNGIPFACTGSCASTNIYRNGATASKAIGGTSGLIGCCISNSNSAWETHGGSLSLFYQLSPSIVAQFFVSDYNVPSSSPGFDCPIIFTPPAGYTGMLRAGSTSLIGDVGTFSSAPLAEWSQVYEGKFTFQFGRGQLQLAALSNYSEAFASEYNLTSPVTVQLFGGGAYYTNPGVNSNTTPVVFNGTLNSVSFFPLSFVNVYHSHNRDVSANYATPLGERGRATASFVHSHYDYSEFENYSAGCPDGTGGTSTFSFSLLPQANFAATDEVRLGYGFTPNDRTSVDFSYYLADARFHVLNPTDVTQSTYIDQNFRYNTPRASFVWRPNRALAIRASMGGGFAIPPLADMVGTSGGVSCSGGVCSQTLQNVNLQPETSWGYDVGFDKRFAQDTILSFDAYSTNLKGQIYKNTATTGTCSTCSGQPLYVTQFGNLAQTRYQGLELDVHRDAPRGIVWSLSGSLMRGYIVDLPAGFYNTKAGVCNLSTGVHCARGTRFVVPNINFNGLFTNVNVPYAQGFAMYGYRWSPDRFVNVEMHYFGNNNGYLTSAFVAFDASAQMPLTKNVALQGTFRNITGVLDSVFANAAQGYIYPTAFGPSAYTWTTPYGPRTFLLTLHIHS